MAVSTSREYGGWIASGRRNRKTASWGGGMEQKGKYRFKRILELGLFRMGPSQPPIGSGKHGNSWATKSTRHPNRPRRSIIKRTIVLSRKVKQRRQNYVQDSQKQKTLVGKKKNDEQTGVVPVKGKGGNLSKRLA